MIKSMTGYGKGEASNNEVTVSVEIKTVNHRYVDVSVKLPRTLLALENAIRKQVSAVLGRGKVDVYVNYELATENVSKPSVNMELAEAYYQAFSKLSALHEELGEVTFEQIISQKDVVSHEESQVDEAEVGRCLKLAVASALEKLLEMRQVEGEETRKDIDERLVSAETILAAIVSRAPQVPVEWQERLKERLERLQQNVEWDPQRIAQEIAVFSDRCDISEEITRFGSHLAQFRELITSSDPVGRRMDFLVQELNREVNTMGSKSNDAELTRNVVALKAELEKVREQVQNIE